MSTGAGSTTSARGSTRVRSTVLVIAAMALAGVVARLLFLGAPVGSDEAGFLLIGGQWHDGASLYGDYWVDRPPVLIALMALAGDPVGLRLIGTVATVTVIGVIALLAALCVPAERARGAAISAALALSALSASPALGVTRTNGEILAAPFVALSMLAIVLALRADAARRGVLLAAGAGAAAALGFGVKQSTIDGFVFGTVLLVVLALVQPARRLEALRLLAAAVAGALAAAAVVVGLAALRGTDPAALFEAVVTFRVEAGETIRASAPAAVGERLNALLVTWVFSGLSLITAAAAWLGVRLRRDPVAVAAAATIAAVSVVALLGGSYWNHYLLQLLPAVGLAVGLLWAHAARPVSLVLAVVVVVSSLVSLTESLVLGMPEGVRAERVGTAIADVAEPDDTIVVAYGQPHVVWNAGLDAPYRYLWSLPARVRDPETALLAEQLSGPDRITWVVAWSRDLESWALDPAAAQRALADGYRPLDEVCDRQIWVRDDVERARPSSPEC